MASLTDIPASILQSANKTHFLKWLSQIPMLPSVRNRLVNLFSEETNNPFTKQDWKIINHMPTIPQAQHAQTISPPTQRRH